MGLFMPISGEKRPSHTQVNLTKGQIYNLDTDEKLSFQFNPATLEWDRKTNWGKITYRGDDKGGDREWINTEPVSFDLPLLYVADPGAPPIEYSPGNVVGVNFSSTLLGAVTNTVDFEFIEAVIKGWEAKLPNKKRPSRLRVFLGRARYFDVIIERSTVRATEFFSDLTVREGIITLELGEWRLK